MKGSKVFWTAVALFAALTAFARPSAAQTATTGAINGTVVDQSGGALPGVTVEGVHDATGTHYETVTNGEGRFDLTNIRPGTYTVSAKISGFKDQVQSAVDVALGANRPVEFKMSVAGVAENVTVTANAVEVQSQAGTASNISNDLVEALPTISRSITDVARTNAFFNPTTLGSSGDKALSVAGQHNRFNNVQIDGAVQNDLFGLADSGTPGGQTGTQPISFDAIDQMELLVSPYDVKQGGFTGGGVNIITKSGTNTFSGTGYYYGRNQSLVGKIPGIATVATPSPANAAVGPFHEKQGGFSLGGPIMKNKVFFFGNADLDRKVTPSGFSFDSSSGQTFGNAQDYTLAQQALAFIQSKYGFNPGGFSEFGKPNNSSKVFVRADLNVSPKNQLTLRTNYVNGLADIGTPTNTQFLLPDRFYSIQDKDLSSVAQLNSTLSGSLVNEARVTYQRERNIRGDQSGFSSFPMVRIDFPDNTNMIMGTENSSQANKLNQDEVEVNDDVTWVKGNHTLSVGTHNEFFKFYNLFIQNLYGNYEFAASTAVDPNTGLVDPLLNLKNGIAQAYSHNFANGSNPLFAAQFSVQQFGLYAGDTWRVAPSFTLTYGVRFDAPHFPDTPTANPITVTDFGLHTDAVPSPKMWSPRVGFTWDMSHGSDNRAQLRGGAGVFSGRTPYVWLSNQYGNTGIDFTSLSVPFGTAKTTIAAGGVAFVADPNNQPVNVGSAGKATVNLIDPNYKYPTIARGNVGYDRSLGFLGILGSVEYVWSKTIDGILYQNLNDIDPTGATRPDGRLVYSKLDANLVDALYLTNTHSGHTNTITGKLERPFKKGFYVSASYLYNNSKSISDGSAFVALTSWRDQYVTKDANNPILATSTYDTGSRILLTATIPVPLWKGLTSAASFFYNGQSGQPYSLVFNGDANNDANSFGDIAFLPSDPSQVVVTNGTYAQLDAYLASDSGAQGVRGTVPNRDIGRSQWSNDLDFRYLVKIPTGGRTKIEATMDITNLLNLFNKKWGWVYYPNFNSPTTLTYGGIDAATGKEIINVATIASTSFTGTSTRDDLRSRWQAQWGLRFTF